MLALGLCILSRIQSKEEKTKAVLVASSVVFCIPTPYIHHPTTGSFRDSPPEDRLLAAMKKNDVIAIIVIILFLVLAGVAFGIATLVHQFRRQTDGSHSGSSGSSSSSDG
ncbi:unnamed protein product [Clonostachys rosea f. rosea IK726]|uniref:Uncharacterized protein n=3 Tax=Bionectria ochroleuca TaxID=29856 RepID=A0A0B7K595_BIOOC|nr:unnamed protein product [Clonostachys rosea f. rosea IK726]